MAKGAFEVTVGWNVKEMGPVFRDAVAQTARVIQQRSREDVAGGLHNGARFAKGTRATVAKIYGGYAIDVIQRPSFAKVWETGGVSRGKPLLWLPAPGNRVVKRKYLGKLIRPKGKRVLLATGARPAVGPLSGLLGAGSTARGTIKYVGISAITNRKRFHLEQIAFEEAQKFSTHWGDLMRA